MRRSKWWLGAALLALAAGPVQAKDPLAPTGRWSANARGAARTPPMGWNSWNAFGTRITEDKVLGAAQALVDTGLAKLGYTYVNIDDGWWLKRRTADGRLQIRTAIFPSAATGGPEETSFRPFTDRLHSMGLKAGIYTDAGRNACSQAFDLRSPNLPVGTPEERSVGLYGHVDQDIGLFFGDWGFDYVKVDACGLADYSGKSALVAQQHYVPLEPLMERGVLSRTDIAGMRALYAQVGEALQKHRPNGDYVFSICAWGQANVRAWGKDVGNLWRTSDDITPSWTRMLHTYDSAADRPLYAQPFAWNDPDMLEIGLGDFDENHLVEARTHFSLWAMINAPLLIGADLQKIPKPLLDILSNPDVIALNQDPGGHQAVRAFTSEDFEILVKTLSTGDKAVLLFNRGLAPIRAILTAEQLKMARNAPIALHDLWSKQDVPAFTGETGIALAPRESRLLIARGPRILPAGMYLSELPGAVNVAVDGIARPEVDPLVHRMVNPWAGSRGPGERPAYGGYGGAQADAAPYGTTLQVAGRVFGAGIGILAGSRMEVRNTGHWRSFAALVGVDDNSRNAGANIRFYVYGDGKLLAKTNAIAFGEPAVRVNADVTGVRLVELVAKPEKNEPLAPASAAWGDAAFVN
jgi:alpha-galactosidase